MKEDFLKEDFNNDKIRLQSAASSIAMRSTFHSTTGNFNKLSQWNNPNPEQPHDPVREIKSSYSYMRPKYEFNNLMIEKNIIQARQRELAEKRTQEEMKEFMNEFGLNRARFKEEVEKKYEMKSLINFYEKNQKKSLEKENEFNTSLIRNASNLSIVTNVKNLINLSPEKLNKNESIKISTNLEIAKVDLNNIKNLGSDNKIKINPEEIKVKINVKENVSSKENNISSVKNKCEKLPNELVAKAKLVDNVFNARHTYSKMLNVKEIDNEKKDMTNINKPLSAYDLSNMNILNMSPIKEKPMRPNTGYEFVRQNFEKDNLFKMRKNLSNFKLIEYSRLKDTLVKLNNTTVNFPALQAAFLPDTEEISYPKFYLPIPGSGLLSRPVDNIFQRNNRATSKKK